MTSSPTYSADPAQTSPSVVFLLSRLGHQASSEMGRALGGLGLEPRQFGLLRLLASCRGDSQRALGAMLRITPNRMVALVDGLESKGLIERRPHPDDRRAYTVTLTEKGAATLDQAFHAAFGVEAEVCASLEPAECEQLLRLLRKLAAAADERTGGLPDVHPGLLETGGRPQYSHLH
jgi:DNA-binding MarR family transcriptional regulator